MTTNNKSVSIWIASILIIIGGTFFFWQQSQKGTTEITEVATSTIPDTSPETANGTTNEPTIGTPITTVKAGNSSDYRSYANGDYNFTITYPATVQSRTSFSTFHELGNNWRLYASQANQGKSIASFSIANIDQGSFTNGKQTYPLFFTAEVRVGVSGNIKDCYATDAGYTNQKVTSVLINGVSFKKFSTTDAATMKYVQAESYRTIHNNMCYVLEQIKNGSNYRDETMKIGTTDQQLAQYYTTGETIIKTFRFTK